MLLIYLFKSDFLTWKCMSGDCLLFTFPYSIAMHGSGKFNNPWVIFIAGQKSDHKKCSTIGIYWESVIFLLKKGSNFDGNEPLGYYSNVSDENISLYNTND